MCFVDIGVHQDGLVHISQITDRYIKHPLEAVSVGDIVDVKVMSVDLKRKENPADNAGNLGDGPVVCLCGWRGLSGCEFLR